MSAATLFFDLDGTLVDSEPGIVASIVHAFDELGQPRPSAQRALGLYRARYDAVGWTELSVFDGIGEVVTGLQRAGHRLAVVTSKNERYARRIVEHLPFGACFEEVIGASEDGERRFKPDLIAEALRRLQIDKAGCVMIGDRRMDIDGANHHGIHSIGVLWGFGDEGELRAAGAGALARTPAELAALLQ
ncbi:HAD-IA family hydrolase [Xanthomonas perforans]|uniref:HAD-IA family hydrolase n=3 Tax=Xanthomonas euvesicatoria TaxID=456327 RepID=A0A6B3KK94_XANEU|nr:HAD-IA family hydrolase [Xanthomonas euvesicatoria]AOY66843.1 HAD family hydrolase [Xanthomonas euvesicatoria pv. vesicatoria str. 85-10]APO89570.1 HAD family hydrolase [Xanthomonas euvesicatoria]KHL65231.1 HAD family hydrolase [Xanthomonas euvesicatoria]KLB40771.1 HAD family hydrolase [Xanthomonas euvesicatoria]KLB45131.1 HAD family hydrolase [Xanthomonas euvesicatoria]